MPATKKNTIASQPQSVTASPARAKVAKAKASKAPKATKAKAAPSASPAVTPVTPAPAASPPVASPSVASSPSPSPSPSSSSSDPNAALAAFAQQAIATLDSVEVGLGADPPLTATDKRHAAKMRKGGDKAIQQIAAMAQQNQLESPALETATMLDALGKADALQPLANRVAAFTKHIGDVIFSAQSAAWVIAMQFYALLQRRASTDAELQKALQPVSQFFAYRHPSAKKPVGSPTKRQVKAVKKAQHTLDTVAGGKLNPSAAASSASDPAPAASASSSPSAAPAAAAVVTNGGTNGGTHS